MTTENLKCLTNNPSYVIYIYFLRIRLSLNHTPKIKWVEPLDVGPLYVYCIHFSHVTHPMGSGRPPWAGFAGLTSQAG